MKLEIDGLLILWTTCQESKSKIWSQRGDCIELKGKQTPKWEEGVQKGRENTNRAWELNEVKADT